jgi:hypothetical protein
MKFVAAAMIAALAMLPTAEGGKGKKCSKKKSSKKSSKSPSAVKAFADDRTFKGLVAAYLKDPEGWVMGEGSEYGCVKR